MQYFPVSNFDWFDSMFSAKLVVGAVANASLDTTALPFGGSISCLQLYTAGAIQCDHIGRFLKVLGDKFSFKVA